MPEIQEYREWLVGAPSDVVRIDTIEVNQDGWASPQYLANWDDDIDAALDDGGTVKTFKASRFHYSQTGVSGMEQSTTVTFSNVGSTMYRLFKDMTPAERRKPVTVKPRLYLSNDLTKPLITPQPVWTLHNMKAGIEALQCEIRAQPLRNRRSGRYYTTVEFPVLVYA